MKYHIIFILLVLLSCRNEKKSFDPGLLAVVILANTYSWDLPVGFPHPNVPQDNPMSVAKVKLGRFLFYDKKLSLNQTQSCASCHRQEIAFTDGLAVSVGSTGELHPRNSQHLSNVAYNSVFTWGNPILDSLEKQAPGPMFGTTPVELGLADREQVLIDRLSGDKDYRQMFADAFGSEKEINVTNIVKAIASFQRTLLSGNSAYDKYRNGTDKKAMSASAIRGMNLFFGERAECFHCHNGFNLADTVSHAGAASEVVFHNTGLYNVAGTDSYPTGNQGIFEATSRAEDKGKFRAPSLRNVELTAPYFHDGSAATLYDVVDGYMAGGRNITTGPHAGDGRANKLKDPLVRSFSLTPTEREDLVNFLRSLTDREFVENPAFASPF